MGCFAGTVTARLRPFFDIYSIAGAELSMLDELKVISLIVLPVFFSACSSAEMSRPAGVSADNQNVPRDAGEIVHSIKRLVEHGDFSDDVFFEKSMGVTVQEFPPARSSPAFEVCGFAWPPLRPATVQHAIYVNPLPWFLDEKKAGRSPCSFTIVKNINHGAIASLTGRLDFDSAKVCITKNDIKREFPSAVEDARNKFLDFDLVYAESHDITLHFLSGSNGLLGNCAQTLVFFQKYN